MARRIGVLCVGCGEAIEVEDEYVPGLPGAELAEHIYRRLPKSLRAKIPRSRSGPWRKTLICGNPSCRKVHTYGTADLRLYDDEARSASG